MKLGAALSAIAISLGVYGCANEIQRTQDGEKGMQLTQVRGRLSCPDLQNSEECAERFAKEFDAAHPGLVLKAPAGGLQVKLRDGQYFSFSTIGEEAANFHVVELQADGRFAIVWQQFYEGNSWQILDRETGKLTEIYGYPLFSPDNTRFVAASEDLQAGFSDTVFDVYLVSAGGITRSFRSLEPKRADWAARDVRWDGKDVIRFSQTQYVGPPTNYDENPAYLAFQNGGWSLHGDKAQ